MCNLYLQQVYPRAASFLCIPVPSFYTTLDFMRSTEHFAVARLDIAISLSDHSLSLNDLVSTILINLNRLLSRTGVERLEGIYIYKFTSMWDR